jgi:hypothetical protein
MCNNNNRNRGILQSSTPRDEWTPETGGTVESGSEISSPSIDTGTYNGPTRTDYIARNKEFFSDDERTAFEAQSTSDAISMAKPLDVETELSNVRVRSLFPTTHESRKRMYTASNTFVYNNSCTPRLNDPIDTNLQAPLGDGSMNKNIVESSLNQAGVENRVIDLPVRIEEKIAENKEFRNSTIEEIQNEFNNISPPDITAEERFDERIKQVSSVPLPCIDAVTGLVHIVGVIISKRQIGKVCELLRNIYVFFLGHTYKFSTYIYIYVYTYIHKGPSLCEHYTTQGRYGCRSSI